MSLKSKIEELEKNLKHYRSILNRDKIKSTKKELKKLYAKRDEVFARHKLRVESIKRSKIRLGDIIKTNKQKKNTTDQPKKEVENFYLKQHQGA